MSTPHHPDSRTLPFAVHVADHEALWADTSRATRPSHLVVTPVDLHQRNVETRLREAATPTSSLTFERIGGVAGDVVEAAGRTGRALDRIDRLELLREVIDGADADVYARLAAVVGDPLSGHVETVERTRSELELVTGFEPSRMRAFADGLGDRDDPATVDALDLLAGVSRVHDDLRRRLESDLSDGPDERDGPDEGHGPGSAGRAVSETSLLCRATSAIADDPELWADAYPDVDRLSVAGTSVLTAPLEDFCRVVARETGVDVHLYLRPASGPAIHDQLQSTAPVDDPGTQGVFTWR